MDASHEKKLANDGDADSGLENVSDSSQSLTTSASSECDESSSDGENFPFRGNVDRVQEVIILRNRSPKNLTIENEIGTLYMAKNDCDDHVKTNLNNNNEDSEPGNALQFFKILTAGQYESVDFSIDSNTGKPKWLDEDKFKRGQKFARDHLFCINFAEMISLFILFAQKSSLDPLIFTGKSDSPFTAFKRYLNTLTKLMSWYTDDVWNDDESEGRKNLKIVRAMHKNVFHGMTDATADELKKRTTLGDPTKTAIWCPMRDVLVSDFRESVPRSPWDSYIEQNFPRKVWVNQADMSITQFGFVGLAVTYPKAFGIHLASEEDLEAFLHMWRGLGFLLGVKDEYNYCNGDLSAVRERTVFFLEVIAKPAFRNVTTDWEHMCRCLTAGISFYLPRVSFEPSLLYLCDLLNIETPRLRSKMTFFHYIIYHIHRFIFYLMRFPRVLSWLNSRLYYIIARVQSASVEVLEKWENKEFAYMKQSGKCPIRGHLLKT